MSETQDRRQTSRRADDKDLTDKIDALISLLTMHMTEQQRNASELKHIVDEYFHGLDPLAHHQHHEYIRRKLTDDETDDAEWRKMKYSLKEKAIIFLFAAAMSYVGALVWSDFTRSVVEKPVIMRDEGKVKQLKPEDTPMP